jgi:hypothetical protein
VAVRRVTAEGTTMSSPLRSRLLWAWLVGLALASMAQAQTAVNYDFQDGLLRGTFTSMKVQPVILTETNGNKYMRITGSVGDCQSIPSDQCPEKNRSLVRFTSHHSEMPLLSNSNMRQTYSYRMRFNRTGDNQGINMQLFQHAPGGEGGYGTSNGTGPVAWHYRKTPPAHDTVRMENLYSNETKRDFVDAGSIVPSTGLWYKFKVVAVWSHDPSIARLEFWFQDVLKKTITGRDVNLGPESNRLPAMQLGLYGLDALGTIDVDDVRIQPTGTDVTPPPTTPPCV